MNNFNFIVNVIDIMNNITVIITNIVIIMLIIIIIVNIIIKLIFLNNIINGITNILISSVNIINIFSSTVRTRSMPASTVGPPLPSSTSSKRSFISGVIPVACR